MTIPAPRASFVMRSARRCGAPGEAGGWRAYVAARRMAYVRIRHEVSKTYAVLPKTKKLRKLRALLHFVFGRNRDVVGTAAAEQASGDGSEKPEAMQVLPDVLSAYESQAIIAARPVVAGEEFTCGRAQPTLPAHSPN